VFKKIFFGFGLLMNFSQLIIAAAPSEVPFLSQSPIVERCSTCRNQVALAAYFGHSACLEKLLAEDFGAAIKPDGDGETPLHFCVKKYINVPLHSCPAYELCIMTLLCHGADLYAKNGFKVTVFNLARTSQRMDRFIKLVTILQIFKNQKTLEARDIAHIQGELNVDKSKVQDLFDQYKKTQRELLRSYSCDF
jgi:hypothetical protein